MTTQQRIFRYFGTIDSERALVTQTAPTVKSAIESAFGVEAYKVKLVGKKLTRFHTFRHFIAYFGVPEHEAVQEWMDSRKKLSWIEQPTEPDIHRIVFWDTRNADHRCRNHYTVTLDINPLKPIPQDSGLAISYNVVAPTNPSITPRREARRQSPPTSGTPAQAPSTVR